MVTAYRVITMAAEAKEEREVEDTARKRNLLIAGKYL